MMKMQPITNVSLEPNIHSDVNFLQDRLTDIHRRTDLEKLIVDGAYYGHRSKDLADVTKTELVPTDLTGQDPKYSTAKFKLKHKQRRTYKIWSAI
ncbi:MAG: hypothetical protein ACOCQ2_03250 [Halanaerobiales bacterium]